MLYKEYKKAREDWEFSQLDQQRPGIGQSISSVSSGRLALTIHRHGS
jgi:hypothetical protein